MVGNCKDRLFCDVAQIMANHFITYFETDILLKDIELLHILTFYDQMSEV